MTNIPPNRRPSVPETRAYVNAAGEYVRERPGVRTTITLDGEMARLATCEYVSDRFLATMAESRNQERRARRGDSHGGWQFVGRYPASWYMSQLPKDAWEDKKAMAKIINNSDYRKFPRRRESSDFLMPATDYLTLQAQIARWCGGSSDTGFAEAVRDAIAMVEAELDRSLRIPEMIARTRATLNETWEALPADLMKLISVSVIEGEAPNQTERSIGQIGEDLAPAHAYLYRTGAPQKFALNATQIRVLPPATAEAPVVLRILYYAKVPRLSAEIPCYAVLLAHPDIYLFGALSFLGSYVEDASRLGGFDARFRSGIIAANRAAVTRDATLAA